MKKIAYEFQDGTTSIVEVNDELANEIIISRRKEENYERKMRYWVKVSLDTSCEYEGNWFADKSPTPEEQYEMNEQQKRIDSFLETLTPTQRRRFNYRMIDSKISLHKIADFENVSYQSIEETYNQIKIKYKKFFNKD